MKDKIIVFLFLGYILTFSILHIIIPDEEISKTERRLLAEFPKFELTNEYIKSLDEYLLDHFPIRDTFRSIKANFNFKVLNKLDNKNIFLKDNYIFKSIYPTNKKSVTHLTTLIKDVNSLLTEENNAYLMLIPDKNYYLESDYFLHIDYNYLYNEINKLDINKIDIRELMNLNDYYETDTHWKQENLQKVVKLLSNEMNFKYDNLEYKENKYNNFYGVLYGDAAIKRNPETLIYLTNEELENVDVKYLDNPKFNKIYNIDKLTGIDPYDVYLNGQNSIIEITNPKSTTNKELIIFRDSFGSSLTPLLVHYYSKITVIDNRWIHRDYLKNFIDFKNQDVLFMYSTLIMNDSFTLK